MNVDHNAGPDDCNLTTDNNGRYLDPALETYIGGLANITATLLQTRAAKNGKVSRVCVSSRSVLFVCGCISFSWTDRPLNGSFFIELVSAPPNLSLCVTMH